MASNRWDALLSNSRWYVPAANLLAYRLESDAPQTPIPASDQTLWSIGKAQNGRFSGRSVARIVDANGGETQTFTQMEGVVTPGGQARITFTTPLGSSITGVGQLRQINDEPAMQMQMITGGGGAYTTHWAYMLRLNRTTTPPEPEPPDGEQRGYRSTAYRWLLGSRWAMAPGDRRPAGAAAGPDGSFTISGYRNGYFWGAGASSSDRRPFTVLGSVTPEGNMFFNAIGSEDFRLRISQVGLLQGNRMRAQARLRPYDAAPGQVEQPLELRLLKDPLIGGGRMDSRGGQRRLPMRPGLGASVPLKQDWPALAGEPTDEVFGQPEQGARLTELALGNSGSGWASTSRPG
jgi:hypothetical protein